MNTLPTVFLIPFSKRRREKEKNRSFSSFSTTSRVGSSALLLLTSTSRAELPAKRAAGQPVRAWRECLARVPGESVWRECLERVYGESVWRECLERVPGESAWRECLESVSGESVVVQERPVRNASSCTNPRTLSRPSGVYFMRTFSLGRDLDCIYDSLKTFSRGRDLDCNLILHYL